MAIASVVTLWTIHSGRVNRSAGRDLPAPVAPQPAREGRRDVRLAPERAEPPAAAAAPATRETVSPSRRAELIASLILEAQKEPTAVEYDKISAEISEALVGAKLGEIVPSLPFGALNSVWGNRLVEGWAREDRMGAARWLATYSSADMAQAIALVHGWVGTDSEQLSHYMEALPPGQWRNEMLKAAAWEAVACGDLNKAIGWATLLNGEDDRDGELLPTLRALAAQSTSPAQVAGERQ